MIKKGILTTNDDLRVLMEAIKSGIFNIGDVQEQLEMKKKKDILSNHTYQIWQGTNGYWYTWVPKPDSPEKRRLIKRKSKSILEDDIINYYTKDDEQDQTTIVTLESLYYEWLDYKKLHTNASSSIRRIDCDWIKYYLSDPIINIPLVQMDKLMLDNWAHKKIKDNDMTKKQYYNMSIILRQSLMYAVDKKILSTSPFKDVIINTKLFRKVKKKDDHTQVYLNKEQYRIEQAAWEKFYSDTSCTTPLAVLFDFQTGVRVGELAAPKWSDIKGNYINIRRMEVRVEKQKEDRTWDKSELIVVDHTKSDAGSREVFLTEEARHILKEVQESNARNGLNSEYIFIDKNGQRISKNKISKYLDRLCKSIGLPPKSPHKARKTYISTLIDAGVNINTIRKQAGHANELTTYKNYCFDRMVDTQKEELLEKALSRKYNNEIVTKSNQKKQDF